jgi:hypothetical protein
LSYFSDIHLVLANPGGGLAVRVSQEHIKNINNKFLAKK